MLAGAAGGTRGPSVRRWLRHRALAIGFTAAALCRPAMSVAATESTRRTWKVSYEPELADMDVRGLTPEEIEVAKLAGRVYLAFKELPQAHPADLGELAFHVHAIGRILFARAAIRAHPEHWTFK